MIKVKALDIVEVGQGMVVGLDEKQAGRRSRFLTPAGKDTYRVEEVIQLKAGEVFYVPVVPKYLDGKLDTFGEPTVAEKRETARKKAVEAGVQKRAARKKAAPKRAAGKTAPRMGKK